MHPSHTDVDRLQHQPYGLIHQPPEPELWRHQVSLVPISFPHNLQATKPSILVWPVRKAGDASVLLGVQCCILQHAGRP